RARSGQGGWNIAALMQGTLKGGQHARFPEIQVSDGRIDFKFDNVKSRFYLTDTDLTVTPNAGGVDIRFSGAPARTDRAAGGYGLFSGRGRWSKGKIDVDMRLEESPVEDFVTLARGRSLGLHGTIAGRARVSGEAHKPSFKGRFELKDVHRWNLIEGHGGSWSMNFRGSADLFGQRFELDAAPGDNAGAPVSLRVLVAHFLMQPRWTVEMSTSSVAASTLLTLARHVGTPIPPGVAIDGNAAGTVTYNSSSGMHGQMNIEGATVKLDDGPAFSLPSATLLVAGDEVQLAPALLAEAGASVQMEGSYAPFREALSVRLSGRNLKLSALGRRTDLPLARYFDGGLWSGTLEYSGSEWKADLQARNTTAKMDGLAHPVRLQSGRVQLKDGGLAVRQMHFRCGDLEGFGHYRYTPGDRTPHRFDISIPHTEAAAVEDLLMPALQPERGFLARTLRLRSAIPEWMLRRRAQGVLRIGAVSAADVKLRGVFARVQWTGGLIRFDDVHARVEDAALSGSAVADLRDGEPRYTLEGRMRRVNWNSGQVDFEGAATTGGLGSEILLQFKADGRFQARSIVSSPDIPAGTASGEFEVAVSRGGPQWKLTDVEAAIAGERYLGEGGSRADGRIELELKSPARTVSVRFDTPPGSASRVTP
ncbi:MAG TPA: hypothetical protein VES20_07930, partial [Bryobacteraceae bacterium]|nr:hypothetical protein [Bryobacteraceae bacterium]